MSSDVESQKTKKFIEKDAGDGTNRFDQQAHGFTLIVSLLSCAISLFLIALDQTIVFTMLETVGNKWGQYTKVSWIASGYMLTMAMFVQIWGKCSIYFGRKNLLMISIVIFEIGSLVAALSPSMDALIVGRIVAGIGGGGVQVLVFIVASELVPIHKRSLVFALMGVIFSISSVVGPLMGGAFTEHVTWRWCFYINLPLGGFALICLSIFFKPPSPKFTWKQRLEQLDYIGMILMSASIVLTLLAMTLGGQELAWDSAGVIVMFILGGLLCIAFCVWNFKYSKSQIIPSAIAKTRAVDMPALHLFLSFTMFMGYSIFLTTYFQVVRGYGSMKSGVHLIPMILSLVISSISTGILIKTTRFIQPFAIFSAVCGSVGLGLSTLLTENSSLGQMIGLMILPGVSVGVSLQSGLMSGQVNAPKVEGAVIMTTSFTNFTRSLGGAIGTSLCQVIYNSSVHNKLKSAYYANPQAFEGITLPTLQTVLGSPKNIAQLSTQGQTIVLECIMTSIYNVFYFCAAIGVAMFVTTLFYSPKRLPKGHEVEKREDYEQKEMQNQAQKTDDQQDECDEGEEGPCEEVKLAASQSSNSH
jgi:EmrB/QacA subfamily drug resistance transporter